MKNKLPIATEAQEQMTFIQWAKNHPICYKHLFAIPNGGSRHPVEAINLKRQGVMAGVSDIFLSYPMFVPNATQCGLYIELKRRDKKARLTKEQGLFFRNQAGVHYMCALAHGWEEAVFFVQYYLREKLYQNFKIKEHKHGWWYVVP